MRRLPLIVMITIVCWGSYDIPADAKRIRQTLKVEKSVRTDRPAEKIPPGREIAMNDTSLSDTPEREIGLRLKGCKFSGYEKEGNSSKESFILMNGSDMKLTGFKVKIDYLDMKGRMLHSRVVTESNEIPAGENRKIDISSWDSQHTYFYHLGNAPKRIATPYKVVFTPLAFWVED